MAGGIFERKDGGLHNRHQKHVYGIWVVEGRDRGWEVLSNRLKTSDLRN